MGKHQDLCWGNLADVFSCHLFQHSGLARVVQAKQQKVHLLLRRLLQPAENGQQALHCGTVAADEIERNSRFRQRFFFFTAEPAGLGKSAQVRGQHGDKRVRNSL